MILNAVGYLEHGRRGKGSTYRDWWLVKTKGNGKNALTAYVQLCKHAGVYLPMRFQGHRVRFKIEVMD